MTYIGLGPLGVDLQSSKILNMVSCFLARIALFRGLKSEAPGQVHKLHKLHLRPFDGLSS